MKKLLIGMVALLCAGSVYAQDTFTLVSQLENKTMLMDQNRKNPIVVLAHTNPIQVNYALIKANCTPNEQGICHVSMVVASLDGKTTANGGSLCVDVVNNKLTGGSLISGPDRRIRIIVTPQLLTVQRI